MFCLKLKSFRACKSVLAHGLSEMFHIAEGNCYAICHINDALLLFICLKLSEVQDLRNVIGRCSEERGFGKSSHYNMIGWLYTFVVIVAGRKQ